ncbi:MAG TPA: AraC family transcriptional regulator [Candidatus Dormibacteraeota bacterium]|nr:AraC family transcriptional regulator [Candidatus Dormibacteraeota bacterium]
MRVAVNVLESDTDPRVAVQHQPALMMALRTGSLEVGSSCSERKSFAFGAGEMCLVPRHVETWLRTDDLQFLYLSVDISDAALAATCDGTAGDVELRRVGKLADARVGALAAAVNAERVAGFPGGRLFLDSLEQALAVALVNGYAVRHRSVQTHRGGLGSARLRRIKEFVDAKIEDELTLCEMAQAVELSAAHFSRMFRKSTGETPHQFLLRQRVERAKTMLRSADERVLDVAVACGFKSQQHFAQAFRRVCGISATKYRQDFLDHE